MFDMFLRGLALVLEVAFFVGVVGSLVVVVITFVEDFHEIFEKDEPSAEKHETAVAQRVQTPLSSDL